MGRRLIMNILKSMKRRREKCSGTVMETCPVSSTRSLAAGRIRLEAAGLGFEAHAADLNPIAVLLNKCNLDIAPRWQDRPPVNPDEAKVTWAERKHGAAPMG